MDTRKYLPIILAMSVLMSASLVDLSAQDKRLGKHTISEWHAIIDSTWGPGLPTSTKLQIFDFFWDLVDKQYAGFPYLEVNWDSLKALYRPQVEAGLSRGRFAATIDKLWFSLQDLHASFFDVGVNGVDVSTRSSAYGPGTPLFWPAGTNACGVFGAALTPLPDSSLLVYRVITAHPLGLVPGDLILGYDRVPWKILYKEILAAGFPFGSAGEWGSTPRSITHSLLTAAGINWGLFDTIDVVKYATGDTVHLPTAPLAGLPWGAIWAGDQVPVAGVRMPNYGADEWITHGVVEGTSIGYVYCGQWSEPQRAPFRAALLDLLTVKKVTGLILDCRLNVGGGNIFPPDAGLDLLFNESPGGRSRWRNAMRVQGSDRFAFNRSAPFDSDVVMQPDYYDRPIAVLTGAATASMGDVHSFRLRFHPMARFFGLPTNGAFCVPEKFANNVFPMVRKPLWETWYYQLPLGQMESLVNNEGFLMHKSFPVDEEVWLTRDGVAKGEDDVVKRALAWITTVTHGHTTRLDRYSARPGVDSLTVTAILANPEGHQTRLSAILTSTSAITIRDSVILFNDGLHGDGAPGDSLWGARLLAPPLEGFFDVSLQTEDLTSGTSRRLPKAAQMTTAGPVECLGDTLASAKKEWGKALRLKLQVVNRGSTAPTPAVTGTVRSLDTVAATLLSGSPFAVGDLTPGVVRLSSFVSLSFADSQKGTRQLPFEISFYTGGLPCWRDTLWLEVTEPTFGVGITEAALPRDFQLAQNYPNPFNPTTTIRYAVPQRSHVRLAVFNTLGQKVAELVNGEIEPGYHEVRFNAADLASGVYFYRLQAGDFVDVKKLLLAR